MSSKPTYEDLGKRVKELEQEVSNYKQDEESLRESEERFRLIFENANSGVCLVDTDGKLMRVNKRMCDIFGHSKKALESMTVNDIAHPDDKDISPKFIKKGISGEVENTVFEKRYFHKQGHIIWGQVSSSVINDAKGDPLYFISHVQDITRRKQVDEELRENERRLRSLFRAAPIGIGLVIDRVLKEANERLCEMTAYSKEELIGQSAKLLYPTDEAFEYVGQEKYAQIRDHGTGSVETQLKRKDGQIIDVLISSTPLDPNDLSKGVTFTVLDITDRKQAEEKILKSEKKYRNLLENIPDVIYSLDRNAKVVAINMSATNFFGFQPDEALGQDFSIFIHPEDKERIERSFLEAIETHREWTRGLQFRGISRDGSVHWLELNSHMHFDENGNYKSEEGVLRDIDNRKKAEEALQKIHQELEVKKTNLEEANTALTVLLKKRDEDHIELEERIMANFNELVMPLTDRLKGSRLDETQKAWLEIMEANLRNIISPFSHELNSKFLGLSSQEFQVANFIKSGKTTKEIGNLLRVATSTIDTYRNNIRKKLGLNNKKINLKTYLSDLK